MDFLLGFMTAVVIIGGSIAILAAIASREGVTTGAPYRTPETRSDVPIVRLGQIAVSSVYHRERLEALANETAMLAGAEPDSNEFDDCFDFVYHGRSGHRVMNYVTGGPEDLDFREFEPPEDF